MNTEHFSTPALLGIIELLSQEGVKSEYVPEERDTDATRMDFINIFDRAGAVCYTVYYEDGIFHISHTQKWLKYIPDTVRFPIEDPHSIDKLVEEIRKVVNYRNSVLESFNLLEANP